MPKNILIIGNGFDLYHHLPTRYSDFMFLANNWNSFYDEYLLKSEAASSKVIQISVPLSDKGELTKEALIEFAKSGYLMNKENICFLNENLNTNAWIRYFKDLQLSGLKWFDFESEILQALYDTEEYSMECIPTHLYHNRKKEIPKRLLRIAQIFGSTARNGYIDFLKAEVMDSYIDNYELQKNKLKLVTFMLDELKTLILCLDYYLSEFVANIRCDIYSEQIRALGEVDVLNFNYTQTFNTIYKSNIHDQHAIHGGIAQKNIILGVSDDAFPNTTDYIRFQKYYQRIQKRTGAFYRNWINYDLGVDGIAYPKDVYIMGHSLGIADFGVLREFFFSDCIERINIYYHSQESYEEYIINLVRVFNKENVIEWIGNGRIVFEKLELAAVRSF